MMQISFADSLNQFASLGFQGSGGRLLPLGGKTTAAGDTFSFWNAFLAVLPLYLSWSLMSLIGIVDLYLASFVGEDAQSALGVADQIIFLTMLIMAGLCAGINTMVSQAWGARDINLANAYKRDGLLLACLIGVLSTVVGWFAADLLAKPFCADANACKQAGEYIRICSLANLPWAIVQYQGAIFRAIGKAYFSTYQWLLMTVVAITPCAIVFCNNATFKSLTPLAIAWVFASIAGAILGQRMLKRSLANVPISDLSFAKVVDRIKKILAVGGPVLLSEISWLLSNLILYALLAKLPNAASAQVAWTVKLKIEETLAYAPLLACSMATASLVGRQIGAQNSNYARKIASKITIGSTAVMVVLGCLTAALAPYIVPNLIAVSSVQYLCQQLLLGSVLTFPLNAITTVLGAAFEGAGRTVPPMIVTFFGFFLIRVPLAWLLITCFSGGAVEVWYAKCISCFIAAVGMIAIYKRIAWSEIRPQGSIEL
jgi:MATE family multidrug resistance protein